MAIRYDQKLNNEIRRIVRNYNAKIRRLEKEKSDVVLPEKYSRQVVKSMKESYSNRSDLRRRLKELERFTARGGEKNVNVKGTVLPKHEYQTIRAYQSLVKRRTTIRLKFYETTPTKTLGVKGDVTLAQTGEREYLNLLAKREILLNKDISNLDIEERGKYLETLRANARTRDPNIWKNNYLSILDDTATSFGYDQEKLKIIKKRLSALTPKQIDELISQENTIQNILYHYSAIKDVTDEVGKGALQDDVFSNLDTIYDNLDKILSNYE